MTFTTIQQATCDHTKNCIILLLRLPTSFKLEHLASNNKVTRLFYYRKRKLDYIMGKTVARFYHTKNYVFLLYHNLLAIFKFFD